MRQFLKVGLLLAALAGCQGILGIEEATLRREGAGGSSAQSGSAGAGNIAGTVGGASDAGAGGESAIDRRFSWRKVEASGPLVLGADGNLWTQKSMMDSVHLLRITSDWQVTQFEVPGIFSIWDLVRGPDDHLWYTRSDPTLGRVTTAGVVEEFAASSDAMVHFLCAGPDGNVWFAARDRFGKVTPEGVVSEYDLPPGTDVWGMTADAESIWMSDIAQNAVINASVSGQIIDSWTTPTKESGPGAMVLGPDGHVWFVERGPNKLARIETTGLYRGRITEHLLPAGATAEGLALGPDGALWVTQVSTKLLVRVTTTGEVTIYALPPELELPGAVAAGSDGNVWFVADGNLVRFEL